MDGFPNKMDEMESVLIGVTTGRIRKRKGACSEGGIPKSTETIPGLGIRVGQDVLIVFGFVQYRVKEGGPYTRIIIVPLHSRLVGGQHIPHREITDHQDTQLSGGAIGTTRTTTTTFIYKLPRAGYRATLSDRTRSLDRCTCFHRAAGIKVDIGKMMSSA